MTLSELLKMTPIYQSLLEQVPEADRAAATAATAAASTMKGSRSHSGQWARRMRARYSSVGSAVAPDTAEDQHVE